MQSRTALLKTTFEKTHARTSTPAGQVDSDEVVPELVPAYTRAWDNIIGEWVFEGVTSPTPSTTDEHWRPSNEIRVPTPCATPTHGSLCDILSGGSQSSGLGGHDDQEDPSGTMLQTRQRLGEFVRRISSTDEDCPRESHVKVVISCFNATAEGAAMSSATHRTARHKETLEHERSNPPPLDATGVEETDSPANTAWVQANQKFEAIRLSGRDETEHSEESAQAREPGCQPKEVKEREPEVASVVETRARVFGGLTRKPRHL